MANQWALLIGINQYAALQPLMYAQADAVALRNFFVDELGIPVDHCTLLTDLSASIEPYAHLPSRQGIESQLRRFCREQVQPGDLLWVFFSGYGLTEAGQDYWMPVKGDPQNLSETAIAVSSIFDILKTATTEQIFLVLDVNRSQGAVSHQNIGEQTLTLAQDFGLPILMSCQPEQYSHETMAIRHGLFTKALLEGLRYHGCVTVSQLAEYLEKRVPELSEHHWRPVQNPVAVIPPAHKFMMIVPVEGISRLPITEQAALKLGTEMPGTMNAEPVAVALGTGAASAVTADTPFTEAPTAPIPAVARRQDSPDPPAGDRPSGNFDTAASAIVPVSESGESTPRLSRLWQLGIAAAVLAFLVGVFVQYRPILLGRGNTEELSPDSDAPEAVDSPLDPEAAIPATMPDPAPDPVGEAPAETTPPETTPPETAVEPEGPSTATEETPTAAPAGPLFPPESATPAEGDSALQRAQAAIAAGRYGEAQTWLAQVPPDSRDGTYEAALAQIEGKVDESTIRNRAVLDQARQTLQPLSASALNDAIEAARQIPPEDPYFEQAQADITRWSQVILDLAEGRAASNNFTGAIAAARLVPEDQPAVYQRAQQQILRWQQDADNQRLIREAQNSLVPGQASSYQNAIRALQQITADQPGYDTARGRINEWSQEILVIARARAAQGNLQGAIAAAALVPKDTAARDQAQAELQRWQEQL